MARDAIPIVQSVINAGTAEGAGVAINPTNGGNIAIDGVTDRHLLIILNSFAGAKNVTIKAGIYPPAFRQGLGDLVIACPQSTQRQIIPLESARFAQADGTINVDFEAAMTGTAFCVKLPPEYS